MCLPQVAAALTVIAGIGEYQAASEATKQHNRNADVNNKIAADARDLKIRQLDGQTQKDLMNLEQEKLDNALEMLRQTDEARVKGAEAGIAGNSLNTITNEFMRRGLMSNTARGTEQDFLYASQATQNKGYEAEALGRLMQKKAKPSALFHAIKTGVSAMTAYNAFAAPAATAGTTATTTTSSIGDLSTLQSRGGINNLSIG